MEEDKDEAILIASTPYLKGKRILKAFTKTKGLISLISPSKLSRPLSSPFSQMEIVYQKKHSDLFSLVEVKIVNYFLPLRQSYDHLQAGATLLKLIIDSQMPGKPARKIYELLLSYLSRISTFSSPDTLASSFALKILSHDGLLRLLPHCSECSNSPLYLYRGDSFCRGCKPSGTYFSSEEWQILLQLAFAETFSSLAVLQLPSTLLPKILSIFQEQIAL